MTSRSAMSRSQPILKKGPSSLSSSIFIKKIEQGPIMN